MRTAKRNLRKEHRQDAAKSKHEKMEEVMKSKNESRMFYKLIKDQRKGSNSHLQRLKMNGTERKTLEEIPRG